MNVENTHSGRIARSEDRLILADLHILFHKTLQSYISSSSLPKFQFSSKISWSSLNGWILDKNNPQVQKDVLNTDQGSLFPIFAAIISAINHLRSVTGGASPPRKSHWENLWKTKNQNRGDGFFVTLIWKNKLFTVFL